MSGRYTVGVEPPSMRKVVPVMKSVSGLARKQTAAATPPHGCELAHLHRSGPEDCRAESREGVLMDYRPLMTRPDAARSMSSPI
jgi:hypothetical protein